ncbi:MAG: hypothetical protein J5661_03495 [Bacteroidaceae bacterium]|nr:hypothetical protein [Bacteroidaceae bacterium]
MKKIILLLPILVMALAACDDDDKYVSYPPTWKGFEVSPTTRPYAGDTIRVTARQDQKGHNIEATSYTWVLSCTVTDPTDFSTCDTLIQISKKTNYDGNANGSDDPFVKFTIPDNAAGRATIRFTAKYSYYSDGIQVQNGRTYDESGLSGSITSTSSTLYGGASGSVAINILPK